MIQIILINLGDCFGIPHVGFSEKVIHTNFSQLFIPTIIGHQPTKCAPHDSIWSVVLTHSPKKYIHLNQSCQIWLNNTRYLKPPNQSVVSRIQINRNYYIITLNIRKRYPPVIKHGNGTSTIYRCCPPMFQLKPLSIHFQIATFDDTGLSIPLDCWFLKLPTMNLNRQ